MAERFPAANAVLVLLVWSAALVWGRLHTAAGPIRFGARDAAGFLAAYGYFLLLRVFDEHKDYAHDKVAHPHRVLQRGLITLGHLRVAGAIAVAIQLGASLLLDGGLGPVTLAFSAALVWSVLMAREFFVGEWLRPRLVLYALSHMIAMPLAVHWMVRMGSGRAPLPLPAFLLPLTSYAYGFAIEIGRKLKAPEEERPEVDSYTRALGTRRAPVILGAIVVLISAAFAWMLALGSEGAARSGATAGVALAGAVGLAACARFRSAPSGRAAKACETAVGVVVLLDHLALLVAVLMTRGFAFG
jgi:4-hydroxybenzoate polyprenyltransferase